MAAALLDPRTKWTNADGSSASPPVPLSIGDWPQKNLEHTWENQRRTSLGLEVLPAEPAKPITEKAEDAFYLPRTWGLWFLICIIAPWIIIAILSWIADGFGMPSVNVRAADAERRLNADPDETD
jgi:hypothetical protein